MRFTSTVLLSFSVLAAANANADAELPQNGDEIKIRQAPGQVVGGDVPNSPTPTQMSPVTTYLMYGPGGIQTPVVYTQTFVPVPDQWDAPKSGSIGMGDIKGQVGVVKTKTKRDFVAEATALVKRTIHDLEKRKKKGGSSGGSGSAASGFSVPFFTTAAGIAFGLLAAVL